MLSARPARPAPPQHVPDPGPGPEDEQVPPRPAPPDCPGRCNAPYRAAEDRRTKQGIEHELEPRVGDPLWCKPCTTSLRGDLTDWPGLAPQLADEVASGVRAAGGEYVSGSKNAPVHQHEAPSFLLDEAARFLTDWAAVIARDRRLAPREAHPGRDTFAAIETACTFLRIHLDWHLAARPAAEHWAAAEFGLELAALTRRARALTGTVEPEPERIIGIPCPNCDRKALERELEDRENLRASVRRYLYDETGEVQVRARPATDEEAGAYRLRPPAGWHPPLRFDPELPERATAKGSAYTLGAATGYIRCRRCLPAFRLTPAEYDRWCRMLEHDARVRGLDVEVKLARVLGSRALGSCANAALPRIEEGPAA